MRILLLCNNRVGGLLTRWMKDRGEELVGLVLHSPETSKYREEIIAGSGLPKERQFDAAGLKEPAVLEAIRALRPEIGISIFFGHLLGKPLLDLFPAGCINLHPALLPYNQGAHPNVWSIVDGTPAGVSLHYMDTGLDTGDLIAQEAVFVEPIDTGERLYRRLEEACVGLFKKTWPSIRAGQATRHPQQKAVGSAHRVCDVDQIDEIDPKKTYSGQQLIDILRARTFPPYPGAYVRAQGKKIYLRLELLEEEQLKKSANGDPHGD